MSKKQLLLISQVALYAAVAWFIVRRFDDLASAIEVSKLWSKPLYIFGSLVFFLSFYGMLAVHWQRACSLYEKYPQKNQWLSYFASQPYKYLPSSVFAFSSRAIYAKKAGLPIKQSSLIQLIENFNIIGGSLLTSALFLIFKIEFIFGVLATIIIILGLLSIALLVPSVKLPKSAIRISGRKWVKLFMLVFIGWIFAGIAFYLLVLGTGQSISFSAAVSANAAAMGLGILAIFAPGGIGVREFVYNKFNLALPGIVLWRLFTLIIDICVGFTSIYIIKKQSSKTEL